ncbi:CIA30 family protein [Ekhidna sp.]|uniref:CIA30 family protein n=1 Tax=Ekhidna sp. TaxID=2608089 RepID=UPI003299DDA6
MLHIANLTLLMLTLAPQIVFDFDTTTNPQSWQIVDDVVMGGRSNGTFTINKEGHGVFSGSVSLENNGGFSSVRHNTQIDKVSPLDKVQIRLKGDGKKYQFRVKQNSRTYYSYIYTFRTSGEWEEIEIPLSEMYPSFRGRALNSPNFSHDTIREVTFLIGNKKAQDFKLTIDKIQIIH